jgi:hypothetical protein
MSDLLTIPLQDDFQTTLQSTWSGGTGSVTVNSVPTATMPSGKYSYIVVNPGEANMQVAKIDWWNGGAKTFNVTSIAVKKGASLDYTTQSHAAGAVVRFSNNYAFWEDIMTAINSKADTTELIAKFGNVTITNSEIKATGGMTLKDDNNPAITLSQLASGSGADTKVAITTNDTTTDTLDVKLTAGDGIKKTVVNPGGSETLDLDIDTADTTTFVKTSSGAVDENKIPVLDAGGKIPNGFLNQLPILLIAWENITKWKPISFNWLDWKAYVSQANTFGRGNFIWFANETVTTGQTVYVNSLFDNNQTWLTIGNIYFLSNTLWVISTTPWTTIIVVGQASSSTSIVINKDNEYIWTGTTYTATSLATSRTWSSLTPVKVKEAKITKSWTYTTSFTLDSLSSNVYNVFWQIYKNWVAYWTLQATTGNAGDITPVENLYFNEWDLIQLYAYISTGTAWYTISSFLVKYSILKNTIVFTDTID